MGLLHVARLDNVPQHSVGLKGQLSGGADDDARRPVAVRPLHLVQALPGGVGDGKEEAAGGGSSEDKPTSTYFVESNTAV